MAGRVRCRAAVREDGFSFIELLVALALLSTAVFAHFALHGVLFLNSNVGQQHLRAHWFGADWIAQAQASVAPGRVLKSGFAQVTPAPPSSFDRGCVNGYCAQERFADLAQTLLKCELGDYTGVSVCQRMQRLELLPSNLAGLGLPAGNIVADQSVGRPEVEVTWWRDETRRWSLRLGR